MKFNTLPYRIVVLRFTQTLLSIAAGLCVWLASGSAHAGAAATSNSEHVQLCSRRALASVAGAAYSSRLGYYEQSRSDASSQPDALSNQASTGIEATGSFETPVREASEVDFTVAAECDVRGASAVAKAPVLVSRAQGFVEREAPSFPSIERKHAAPPGQDSAAPRALLLLNHRIASASFVRLSAPKAFTVWIPTSPIVPLQRPPK
jgi:hypothetical protein